MGSLSFSRGSSPPRGWTQASRIAGGFLTSRATGESLKQPLRCAALARVRLLATPWLTPAGLLRPWGFSRASLFGCVGSHGCGGRSPVALRGLLLWRFPSWSRALGAQPALVCGARAPEHGSVVAAREHVGSSWIRARPCVSCVGRWTVSL